MSLHQTYLVSVITPCFNAEKTISETIESVINQSYKNWELIIVDDASSDNSVEIIQKYTSQFSNIKLIKIEENSGASISRNTATEHAKGNFITFLDSDDLWLSHKLETQINFMLENNLDVCFSSYELMNEEGESLNKMIKALPVLSYNKLLKSNYVGNLTGIYNAKTLDKIYAPNLKKRQDWLLWLKAIETSKKPAKSINESLAKYRVRRNSISSNKINLLKYNYLVYKKGLGYSPLKSFFCLIRFLFEHFFVKSKQTVFLNKS